MNVLFENVLHFESKHCLGAACDGAKVVARRVEHLGGPIRGNRSAGGGRYEYENGKRNASHLICSVYVRKWRQGESCCTTSCSRVRRDQSNQPEHVRAA